MINLLPDTKKVDIRAARSNTILVRYIFVLIIALLFILGVVKVSQQTLDSLNKDAQSQLSNGSGVNTTNPAADPQTLQRISSQVSTSSSVSDLLVKIAQATPEGVVMKQLQVKSDNMHGSPLALEFYSKSGVQSSDILQSISQVPTLSNAVAGETVDSKDVPGYPKKHTITVTLQATMRTLQ